MKILADENIPFVNELFGPLGEVILRPGRSINANDVLDVDILIVRSVTPINEALLAGSKVKFVGTCTIGIDHLDCDYLESRGIAYASAPGCNAKGVVQYALSAMATLGLLDGGVNTHLKIAVVGCGNVGGTLLATLNDLGFDCFGVDPLIPASSLKGVELKSLNEVTQCDVICVHAPYTTQGESPTHHLFDEQLISQLKKGVLLLNAGRGGVIDNTALLRAVEQGQDLTVVLDVWEPEPGLNTKLLERVSLGSTHIAGYSYEGRVNGSLMIHSALLQFLQSENEPGVSTRDQVDDLIGQGKKTIEVDSLSHAILATYDVRTDDKLLRAAASELPGSFDKLRKNYIKRREFSHYYAVPSSRVAEPELLEKWLGILGFLNVS